MLFTYYTVITYVFHEILIPQSFNTTFYNKFVEHKGFSEVVFQVFEW